MLLASPAEYVRRREAYAYSDEDVEFTIAGTETGNLRYVGTFGGIFPTVVPSSEPGGVNLRKFEAICQSVFSDCYVAFRSDKWSEQHLCNLKAVICAIVHWKMASQGGRAGYRVRSLLQKWGATTHRGLMRAHEKQDLSLFCIPGARIPTASAFLRFLFPEQFGIIDSRVAARLQSARITTLSIRNDGYINDTPANRGKYHSEYIPFLRAEAGNLDTAGAAFEDRDEEGVPIRCPFRPCDVEMALFIDP